jgi:hypothetical protein
MSLVRVRYDPKGRHREGAHKTSQDARLWTPSWADAAIRGRPPRSFILWIASPRVHKAWGSR